MRSLIIEPTATAQWHTLVKEAENACHLILSEELESYLVFLLIRFMHRPEMAGAVIATELLQGIEKVGAQKEVALRDVGDKCLLLSGFFPARAQRKRVRISYFVRLGQSAYVNLAEMSKQKLAELYQSLGSDFVGLMDVLQGVRDLSGEANGLTLLQAEEVWNDLQSPHARAVLQRYFSVIPVRTDSAKFS